MEDSQTLHILNQKPSGAPAAPSGMGRREAVRRLLAGAGGALVIPGLASAHPMHKHLSDAATFAAADAKAAAADWAPEFLDAHENETLGALAERIVPGSTKAQVNRFIDLLLSVDTQENQKQFMAALSAFEGESLSRFGHPWIDLSEHQQNKILDAASTSKSGGKGNDNMPASASPSGGSAEPVPVTIRDHFENMKGWVSGAYYSSEIGMRELGWTGDNMFESFPGCEHPGGHH